MFVQVIDGKVSDAGQMRTALERWAREVAPGAVGWLDFTGGVTADDRFIGLARFESAEAARRNSARPEQDRWWTQTAMLFTGRVTFRDSSDVVRDVVGDTARAGFVQVMRGRSGDLRRTRELMTQNTGAWAAFRPEIIGSVAVGHEGGAYTVATYFTSQAAAREGEHRQPPLELAADMEEMSKLNIDEPEYFDLTEPWVRSR